MKTIRIGVCSIFVSMLVGCGFPVGNFSTGNAVVTTKEQTEGEKKLKIARYEIRFRSETPPYVEDKYWYIFSDDFGNAGDSVICSNKMIFCKPPVSTKLE